MRNSTQQRAIKPPILGIIHRLKILSTAVVLAVGNGRILAEGVKIPDITSHRN